MSTNPPNPASSLQRDPVCGMNVDPATARHVYAHGGKSYYFCCAGCSDKFKADPAKYLSLTARPSSLVALGAPMPATTSSNLNREQVPSRDPRDVAYVCPMCPEVQESKPGVCPSCGMALELEMPLASPRTEYTCPMHPEIVRPAPGSCPICGLALEPRTVTAAAIEDNPELRDM